MAKFGDILTTDVVSSGSNAGSAGWDTAYASYAQNANLKITPRYTSVPLTANDRLPIPQPGAYEAVARFPSPAGAAWCQIILYQSGSPTVLARRAGYTAGCSPYMTCIFNTTTTDAYLVLQMTGGSGSTAGSLAVWGIV